MFLGKRYGLNNSHKHSKASLARLLHRLLGIALDTYTQTPLSLPFNLSRRKRLNPWIFKYLLSISLCNQVSLTAATSALDSCNSISSSSNFGAKDLAFINRKPWGGRYPINFFKFDKIRVVFGYVFILVLRCVEVVLE